MNEYYFQVKVGLTDKEVPNKILLSTPLMDLIPDCEIIIVNVPTSVNRIDVCGSFSEQLGPGVCLIKFGHDVWQTIHIHSTVHDNLLISCRRKENSGDRMNIRIKVLFPQQRTADIPEMQTLNYDELSSFVQDITDY